MGKLGRAWVVYGIGAWAGAWVVTVHGGSGVGLNDVFFIQ